MYALVHSVCEKKKEVNKWWDEEAHQKELRYKENKGHLFGSKGSSLQVNRFEVWIMRCGAQVNSPQWFSGLNDQETARFSQEKQN